MNRNEHAGKTLIFSLCYICLTHTPTMHCCMITRCLFKVWIILLASALAQLVSCIVTCPVEAVRIRVMTCDKRPEFLSFVGTAQEMLDENGLAYFWSGLGALLFRELPFAIAKVGVFVLNCAPGPTRPFNNILKE